MKKILIIGGYGGFGKRLVKRLSESGDWHIIIAGRNKEKARKLSSELKNCEPLECDRNSVNLDEIFQSVKPYIVIDAAGPFQNSHYNVVKSCIASDIHYIDLADSREFVLGIKKFDEAAQSAGVSIISGASSVPALSRAVVDKLVKGMDEVCTINISISASNRASAGNSVAHAILNNIGKPLKIWRSKQWQSHTGWQMLRREKFQIGNQPIARRFTALVDVPDHEILPSSINGFPSTIFRAGPELSFQTLFLWLCSWPVKWRWIKSLSSLSKFLLPLQSLTSFLGSDTSFMKIEVKGYNDNQAMLKRWTLVARDDHGPDIPTFPAELIAEMLVNRSLKKGAYHASGLLKLEQFDLKFNGYSIETQIDEENYSTLYQRVMGDEYQKLSPAVQSLHRVFGNEGASGKASVKRGTSFLSKCVALVGGFPPAGNYNILMDFVEDDGVESWTRNFYNETGHHKFTSHLSQSGHYLIERFGPMRFYFDIYSLDGALIMDIKKWSIFNIPMPLFLGPKPVATESQITEGPEKGSFCFDVQILMPLIGEVVHYKGSLNRL